MQWWFLSFASPAARRRLGVLALPLAALLAVPAVARADCDDEMMSCTNTCAAVGLFGALMSRGSSGADPAQRCISQCESQQNRCEQARQAPEAPKEAPRQAQATEILSPAPLASSMSVANCRTSYDFVGRQAGVGGQPGRVIFTPLMERIFTRSKLEAIYQDMKACTDRSRGAHHSMGYGDYKEKSDGSGGAIRDAAFCFSPTQQLNGPLHDYQLGLSRARFEAYACHRAAGWPTAVDYQTTAAGRQGAFPAGASAAGTAAAASTAAVSGVLSSAAATGNAQGSVPVPASAPAGKKTGTPASHCISAERNKWGQIELRNSCNAKLRVTYCLQGDAGSIFSCTRALASMGGGQYAYGQGAGAVPAGGASALPGSGKASGVLFFACAEDSSAVQPIPRLLNISVTPPQGVCR